MLLTLPLLPLLPLLPNTATTPTTTTHVQGETGRQRQRATRYDSNGPSFDDWRDCALHPKAVTEISACPLLCGMFNMTVKCNPRLGDSGRCRLSTASPVVSSMETGGRKPLLLFVVTTASHGFCKNLF